MENIDEFMHQKFNSDDPSERFPFREEYWEQAEAMLAADEAKRRKRRRFLFWWWFCALLLLSGGGYMARQWAMREPVTVAGSDQKTNGVSSAAENSKTHQPAATGAAPATAVPPATLTEAQRQAIEKQYLKAKLDKADAFDEPATPVNETTLTSTKSSRTNKTTTRKSIPENTGSIEKNTRKSSGAQQKKGDQVLTDKAKALPAQGKTSVPVVTSAANLPRMDTMSATVKLPENIVASPADTTGNRAIATALPALLTSVAFIPVIVQPLGIAPEQLNLLSFASPAIIKKAPPEQRYSIGLAASSTIYKKNQVGGNAGIFMAYKLTSKWHPFAGINWRYMPLTGNSTFLKEITDLRYSFGYQSTRWKTEVKAVQSIEIPLGIKWQQQRFMLEAGITPGVLLGVTATQTKIYTESLHSTPVITSVNVAAKRSAYRQSWVAPFVGVAWQATPQLGIWMRGYYRSSSVVLPAPEVTVNVAGPYMDLGIHWLLIN